MPDTCPSCGAKPFRPFLRAQLVRTTLWQPLAWLSAWWRGRPFASTALVCMRCRDIVGWENPYADLEGE